MIPETISEALFVLKTSRCPENVFGTDVADIKTVYRDWCKIVHEDLVPIPKKSVAHEAFLLLTKWWNFAETKISRGTYGDNRPTVLATFKTKTASYSISTLSQTGEMADLYEGETDKGASCLVKVCRSSKNNDLMKNEADILAALPAKFSKPEHSFYFPNLLDSFEAQHGKMKIRINVFANIDKIVRLTDVISAFPNGIDIKDAAWMWNRILESVHLFHSHGYIHTSITPDNFFLNLDTHQGVLFDFCYAVERKGAAKAFNYNFRHLYPPEIFAKKPLDFSTDLYMMANIMNLLLGGRVNGENIFEIPIGIPIAVAGLLRSCRLGKAHRTNSAHELYEDFKEIRNALGWKKEFRQFSLVSKT